MTVALGWCGVTERDSVEVINIVGGWLGLVLWRIVGYFVTWTFACGAFGLKAESLFFAGPKKSNPKKWPERLLVWVG